MFKGLHLSQSFNCNQNLVNFILRVYPDLSRQLQANTTSHAFDGKKQGIWAATNLFLLLSIYL